jgi:hypothetical protein
MVFQFRKNLIIVNRGEYYDPADFVDIGNRIAARAPDIRVFVIDDSVRPSELPAELWSSPTLTVAFRQRTRFRPKRGTFLFNRPIEKLEQSAMMMRLGVEVPHSEIFTEGMDLPEDAYGEFVVLKPADLKRTSKGDSIQIFRRQRLAAMPWAEFPADHPVRNMPMLVQRFIDTGEYPVKHRVLTLFGEVLYCQHTTLKEKRPDLLVSDHVLEKVKIATNSGERIYMPSSDRRVLDFARKVAGVFGGVPLLGIDMIQDVVTKRCYALEVNAGGNVWHFSSPMWAERRARHPEVERDMREQFGAFDVAAKSLISATRRLAS